MAGMASVATFGLRFVAENQASAILMGLAKDYSFFNRITGRGFEQVAQAASEKGLKAKLALGSAGLVAYQMAEQINAASDWCVRSLTSIVDAAKNFEYEMNQYAIVAGESIEKTGELSQKVIEFTAGLPTSASQVARAAIEFAKMGMAVEGNADQMIRMGMEAVKLGRVIEATDAEAAMFIGKLSTWLAVADPTPEKMNVIASTVARLGVVIKGTSQDVIRAVERFGAFAKTLGATDDEVLALGALVQDSGLLIQRGSTAINRTFQLMSTNTKAFGQVLSKIGVVASSADFTKMFQTKPIEAFRRLMTALQKQGGQQATKTLKMLGLHGNYISDLITMSGNLRLGVIFDEAAKESENAANGMSFLDQAFKQSQQTLTSALETMKGSLESVKILLGSGLVRPVYILVIGFSELVKSLLSLAGTKMWLVGWFFAIITAATVLFAIGTKLVLIFGALKMAGLTTFATWFKRAIIFIAVMVALVAILSIIWYIWKRLNGEATTLSDSVKDVTGGIRKMSQETMGALAAGVTPDLVAAGGGEGEGLGGMELPGAAAGGVAIRPTPVVVGEAGAEAIVPLRELASIMQQYTRSSSAGGGGGSVSVSTPLYLDGMQIARSVADAGKIDSIRQGRG